MTDETLALGGPDLSEVILPETQLHRIAWFVEEGAVGLEMECLHDKLPHLFRCDKLVAEEEPQVFIDSFDGDRVPLRDGLVLSRWVNPRARKARKGYDRRAKLQWVYVTDPAQAENAAAPAEVTNP